MDKKELESRTKTFAILSYKFAEKLPRTLGSEIIARQLIRSSSSVAANYRSVNRAKSDADFLNKLKIVQEEADETLYWLQFIEGLELEVNIKNLAELINECNQLLSIVTASIITLLNKKNAIRK
jgi:four helix bundle protein